MTICLRNSPIRVNLHVLRVSLFLTLGMGISWVMIPIRWMMNKKTARKKKTKTIKNPKAAGKMIILKKTRMPTPNKVRTISKIKVLHKFRWKTLLMMRCLKTLNFLKATILKTHLPPNLFQRQILITKSMTRNTTKKSRLKNWQNQPNWNVFAPIWTNSLNH